MLESRSGFAYALDRTQFQRFRDVLTGYHTYSDLLSTDCETINRLRVAQQWNADAEIEYLETRPPLWASYVR